MYCENCGEYLASEDKFCPKCGAPNAEKESPGLQFQKEESEITNRKEIYGKKKIPVGYILAITVLGICIAAGVTFVAFQGLQLKDALDEDTSKAVTVKDSTIEDAGEERETKEKEAEKIEIGQEEKKKDNKVPDNTASDGTVSNNVSANNNLSKEYILPDGDKKVYTDWEINALNEHDLFIARNEFYARHGRQFDSEELRTYFASKSWYVPQYAPAEFDAFGDSKFNEFEIQNRNAVIARQKQLGVG